MEPHEAPRRRASIGRGPTFVTKPEIERLDEGSVDPLRLARCAAPQLSWRRNRLRGVVRQDLFRSIGVVPDIEALGEAFGGVEARLVHEGRRAKASVLQSLRQGAYALWWRCGGAAVRVISSHAISPKP